MNKKYLGWWYWSFALVDIRWWGQIRSSTPTDDGVTRASLAQLCGSWWRWWKCN